MLFRSSLKRQKGRVRIDSYSGHGEVFSAFEIGRLFSSHASEAKLIRATEGARDLLREANVIWLGSPLASEVLGDILKMDIWIRPWECSFEHSEANPPGNTVIKCNGRKHTYTTKAWGASKKEYGWIGLSKTRYHTYFLLLAGTDTSATRACTELACSIDTPNEECMREILEKRADSDGTFEVLIELTKGAQAAALGPIVWSRQALQTGDAEN